MLTQYRHDVHKDIEADPEPNRRFKFSPHSSHERADGLGARHVARKGPSERRAASAGQRHQHLCGEHTPRAGDRDVTDRLVGQLDLKVVAAARTAAVVTSGRNVPPQPGGPPGRFIFSEAVPGTRVPSARISLASPNRCPCG